MKSFDELTSDPQCSSGCRRSTATSTTSSGTSGIFAEDYPDYMMMGELLTYMVANDAFTQALTNPLLARNVFNDETFTTTGMKIINDTSSLQDIVARNSASPHAVHVSFSYARRPRPIGIVARGSPSVPDDPHQGRTIRRAPKSGVRPMTCHAGAVASLGVPDPGAIKCSFIHHRPAVRPHASRSLAALTAAEYRLLRSDREAKRPGPDNRERRRHDRERTQARPPSHSPALPPRRPTWSSRSNSVIIGG